MITPNTPHEQASRSSSDIQSDIRETRSRMDATLDELGHRLTPRSLVNSVLDWWETPNHAHPGAAASRRLVLGLARQARNHPMPALLIGSGIAWLIADTIERHEESSSIERVGPPPADLENQGSSKLQSARQAASGAIDTVREKTAGLTEKVQHKMQATGNRIGEQAHEVMQRGRSKAHDLTEGAKHTYHMGMERFSRASDEAPLAVGLGFAALGALIGLVIPGTRREDEWMGEQSDQLMQQTKDKAGELLESGKAVGTRVIQAVKDETREQGLTGGAMAGAMSQLAEKGEKVVQRAKDEAGKAAEEQGLKPGSATGQQDKSCSCEGI